MSLDALAPDRELHLWPHRSLSAPGFVGFISITAALSAVPLLAVLGTGAIWILLPLVSIAVAGIWWALLRNNRDAQVYEVLSLDKDLATLRHRAADGTEQCWQANPHWVRIELHPTIGPVPNYLTLKGGPREVELGAFLSADERVALARDLTQLLASLR